MQTGIPANRILVGGFSQGGALALHTGLTFNQTLAGVIALSCWLPIHKSFPDARKASENLPVFQCHGEVDPVVPYKFGQLSHVSLKSFMKNVQFNSYPGLSHTSSQQEMDDVKVCMRLYVIHKRGRLVKCAHFPFRFAGFPREIRATTVREMVVFGGSVARRFRSDDGVGT